MTIGKQKYYSVGPLCLAEVDDVCNDKKEVVLAAKPAWIQWLDEKLWEGKSVLYVAFGSQAEISEEQLEEIARRFRSDFLVGDKKGRRWVGGAHEGERDDSRRMGGPKGDTGSRQRGRVFESLRLELGDGGSLCWSADAGVADDGGATVECEDGGGGGEGGDQGGRFGENGVRTTGSAGECSEGVDGR
ncbi:unnamed protein product [Linum trigynum]|uniref:Uncharacterized protein n=1 Tax=Linum trigynum TaxID=586398 RepID=A0AAV2CPJ7_9ROSI